LIYSSSVHWFGFWVFIHSFLVVSFISFDANHSVLVNGK
jgi:hypothetical protein